MDITCSKLKTCNPYPRCYFPPRSMLMGSVGTSHSFHGGSRMGQVLNRVLRRVFITWPMGRGWCLPLVGEVYSTWWSDTPSVRWDRWTGEDGTYHVRLGGGEITFTSWRRIPRSRQGTVTCEVPLPLLTGGVIEWQHRGVSLIERVRNWFRFVDVIRTESDSDDVRIGLQRVDGIWYASLGVLPWCLCWETRSMGMCKAQRARRLRIQRRSMLEKMKLSPRQVAADLAFDRN